MNQTAKLRVLAGAAAIALTAALTQAGPLTEIGRYESGVFDESAAEIPAYDPNNKHLFVTNATIGVDVLDLSDPTNPTLLHTIEAPGTNSVAVYGGRVALAVENANDVHPGTVQIFEMSNASGSWKADFKGAVATGVLPDMVTVTPDGQRLLVANEAEPGDIDPVGGVTIIDTTSLEARTVGFEAFNDQVDDLIAKEVRLFPEVIDGSRSVAQDLEPEYIAVSPDSTKAYVGLQEANAFAVVDLSGDLEDVTVTDILGLGYKDHSLEGNGIDASDKDDGINIQTWPVRGLYQPDAITSYQVNGQTYIVSANEGDARDQDERIEDLSLDPTAFPNAADLQEKKNLGRLDAMKDLGDTDGDGDYDELYSYGSRSFTIWTEVNGEMVTVYDSGDDFEQYFADPANGLTDHFNTDNDENDFDSRSDAKGPEPEGVTLGLIGGRYYAFVGLERVGGVMVYDVTDPENPLFRTYVNGRNFDKDPDDLDEGDNPAGYGDLGPEGLLFLSKDQSPNGEYMLIVTNEVSGTTTLYQIDENAIPEPASLSLLAVGGLAMLRRRKRS
jgi:hypothetical protein